MPTNAFPSTVSQVDTAARFPLGYEVTVPATAAGTRANQGEQLWVYVFNDDPTNAFAAGTVVYRDPSATTHDFYGALIAPTSVISRQYIIGIAQHAIAIGSYGFVLVKGVGTILAGSAGLALDTEFTTGGSAVGTVLAVVANADATTDTHNSVIGHSATALAAAATGTAFINCPG